jgi:hypothetical protein
MILFLIARILIELYIIWLSLCKIFVLLFQLFFELIMFVPCYLEILLSKEYLND